jgi:hypothetical protein
MYYRLKRNSLGAKTACLSLVLAAFLTAAACQQNAEVSRQSPAESAKAVEDLVTWFECEECQSGELAAVTKYGQTVVPSLIAVLRGGLSPASRELLRRQLEDRYAALTDEAQRRPNLKLASNKEQFVTLYLGNFDAQYRARAAQALGAIGGAQARAALDEGLRSQQREDVRRTISESLRTMK